MTLATYAISLRDVQQAALRISGLVHQTPLLRCRTLDRLADCEILLKCEQFQKVGAFKFRGACHAVGRLSDAQAAQGVVTHSSGNHAQAVALAAKMRGIPAHIVMPTSAPDVKRRAVQDYGGEVVSCEPTLAAREQTAEAIQAETGATFIHPYDHPQVMAGQGTVGLEILQQSQEQGGPPQALIVPVGGGGLLSGICTAVKGIVPKIRIFAAEPEGADDAARSFASGSLVRPGVPKTIADGLLTGLGELTWPIIRDHVEEVITVSDVQIVEAMRLLWERAKLVVEPSAAVSLAVVLSERFRALSGISRVAVVLTGGNVDLDRLPW